MWWPETRDRRWRRQAVEYDIWFLVLLTLNKAIQAIARFLTGNQLMLILDPGFVYESG